MKNFNLTWNQTLKINYVTFHHRCKFILHEEEEKLKSIKRATKKK